MQFHINSNVSKKEQFSTCVKAVMITTVYLEVRGQSVQIRGVHAYTCNFRFDRSRNTCINTGHQGHYPFHQLKIKFYSASSKNLS